MVCCKCITKSDCSKKRIYWPASCPQNPPKVSFQAPGRLFHFRFYLKNWSFAPKDLWSRSLQNPVLKYSIFIFICVIYIYCKLLFWWCLDLTKHFDNWFFRTVFFGTFPLVNTFVIWLHLDILSSILFPLPKNQTYCESDIQVSCVLLAGLIPFAYFIQADQCRAISRAVNPNRASLRGGIRAHDDD